MTKLGDMDRNASERPENPRDDLFGEGEGVEDLLEDDEGLGNSSVKEVTGAGPGESAGLK